MNAAEFQQAQDVIFARLDAHRPPVVAPVALSRVSAVGKVAWSTVQQSFGLAGVIATEAFTMHFARAEVSHSMGQLVLLAGLGYLLGRIPPGLLSFAYADLKRKKMDALMGEALLSLGGQTAPVSTHEAEEVAKWAQQYPRIADLCVSWMAQNSANVLTKKSYKVLDRAVARLGAVERAFATSEADRKHAIDIVEALNKHGLVDRAISQAQAIALENRTPAALPAAFSSPRL